jgi:hypothetical protein
VRAFRNVIAALTLLMAPFVFSAIDTAVILRRERARRDLRYN